MQPGTSAIGLTPTSTPPVVWPCVNSRSTGFGLADYLLYIDRKAAGVIEARKEGTTLIGVEVQSARHAQGLPATLPAWRLRGGSVCGTNAWTASPRVVVVT